MKPLRVLMTNDDLERLERWSKERGWTKSHAIRFAIRALVGGEGIMSASGLVEGLPADLSRRDDA